MRGMERVVFETNRWVTKNNNWRIRGEWDKIPGNILMIIAKAHEKIEHDVAWSSGIYSDHYCCGWPPRYWTISVSWLETRNYIVVNIHGEGGNVWRTTISMIYDKMRHLVEVYVDPICDAVVLLDEIIDAFVGDA